MIQLERDDPAVKWLLDSGDPSIQYLTLTSILDEPRESAEVRSVERRILRGPIVRTLLSGQRKASGRVPVKMSSKKYNYLKFSAQAGGFGVHPYQKWTGAHWRLVSLVDLSIPAGHRPAIAAARQVLRWLWGESHRKHIVTINGRTRRCASQEGNALGVCSRLGLVDDPQVRGLAESIVEWQWPDGGWNCDKIPQANHSSFYESLATMWGLIEYHRASGDKASLAAAHRTAEMFLRHHLFRSEKTGNVIDPEWLRLHYPLYWHYDVLQALRFVAELGKVHDERAGEALKILESKRRADGLWHVESCYWSLKRTSRPLQPTSNLDIVNWGRRGPSKMITLNALRVLKAANRLN
jgi:hypothetical protein